MPEKNFNLERFKLTHRLQGLVNGLEDDLVDILKGALERVEAKIINLAVKVEETESLIKTKKYLDRQRSEIQRVLNEVYRDMGKVIEDKAVEVGMAGPEISKKILLESISPNAKTVIATDFIIPTLDKSRIKKYLESTKIEGLYFNEWLKKLEDNAVHRIIRETQISMVLSEPYQKTAKRVQQALEVSRKSAQGLTQNAIFQAYNYAERETYLKNEERLKGLRFVAELDVRTTPLCRSLDQQIFPPRDAPQPPLHWKCRSMCSPVFRPIIIDGKKIDLEKEIKGKRIVRIESNPRWIKHRDGTRSKAYQDYDVTFVRGRMTYNEMLTICAKSKDPSHVAFAREVLGPTRLNLVVSGKLKMESLYYAGKLRTIKELERLT